MVNIQNIIRDNDLLLLTFNIRIKKTCLKLISKILLWVRQLIHSWYKDKKPQRILSEILFRMIQ